MFNSLCFTSQGKGRLEYGRNKHLFNYEALYKEKEQTWSLALDLPVIGQELITFLPVEGGSNTRVEGTFANRLSAEITSAKQKKLLKDFYQKVGELVLLTKARANNSIEKLWNIEQKEGELLLTSPLGKADAFSLKAFEWDKHFKRMTLSYDKKISGQKKSLMKLQLFVYECSL